MRVIIQRVNHGSVRVDGVTIGEIDKGLLLLVGFGAEDDSSKLSPMAEKIRHMRLFPDNGNKFHLSVVDATGAVLAVPQFTLYADTSKGRRPDFFGALHPEKAESLFGEFVEKLKAAGIRQVETGRFGAYMQVTLENDGPVTISLEN